MHKSLFAAGAATGEDAPTALSYAVFRTLELSVVFWPIALFAFRRPGTDGKECIMKLKIRYENTYQTLEVETDTMKSWLSIDVEDGEDVEAAIQERFEEVWNKPDYNNWHHLNRRIGQPKMLYRRDEEDADAGDGVDTLPDTSQMDALERKMEDEEVRAKLRALLKPEYADVLIAVELDGMSAREYAESRGEKENTVSHRRMRAKKKLREIFSKMSHSGPRRG